MKKILAFIILLIAISSCVKQSQKPDKTVQADLYYNKGLEYYMKGDNKTAITYYDSAIMVRDDASYYNNRGSAKYALEDTTGAFNDFSKAIKIDSTNFIATKNLAVIYQDKKEYIIALKYHQQSYQINNKQAIYDLMGYCEYMLGNYKEALTYYEKHLEGKNPLFPETSYLYMGYCYEKLGDINAAKEHWEKAAKMGEEEAQHKLDSLKRL